MTDGKGASNTGAELRRRAERRVGLLDQIGELQEELKLAKAEDKADGFTEKALAQVVKELRRGAEYQADVLQLELELDTYRAAVGLPRTLEDAQRQVAEDSARLEAAE